MKAEFAHQRLITIYQSDKRPSQDSAQAFWTTCTLVWAAHIVLREPRRPEPPAPSSTGAMSFSITTHYAYIIGELLKTVRATNRPGCQWRKAKRSVVKSPHGVPKGCVRQGRRSPWA
eukprot:scaffold51828_cov42-Prasinocladus_malaysianus.AAC.3